jgi:predicted GNAT family N-acyltransferase
VPAEVIDGARSRELRRTILRPELGPSDPLPGDDLEGVIHFGVLDADGTAISTCLLFPEPFLDRAAPGWHLRQMATDPEHRGQGYGAQVLTAVIDYVAAHGGGVLWCDARETAVPFYSRQKFHAAGGMFIEHGLPHMRMWRTVEGAAHERSRP